MRKKIHYFILISIFLYALFRTLLWLGFIGYTLELDEHYYLSATKDRKNDITIISLKDRRDSQQILIGPSIEKISSNDDLIIGLVVKYKNDALFNTNNDSGYFIFNRESGALASGLSLKDLIVRLKEYSIDSSEIKFSYPSASYKGHLPPVIKSD